MLSPKAIESGHFFRLEVIEDKIQGNLFLGSLMDGSVFAYIESGRWYVQIEDDGLCTRSDMKRIATIVDITFG